MNCKGTVGYEGNVKFFSIFSIQKNKDLSDRGVSLNHFDSLLLLVSLVDQTDDHCSPISASLCVLSLDI